jgi:hypothetical protein
MGTTLIVASASVLAVVTAALLAYVSQRRVARLALALETRQLLEAFGAELQAAQVSFQRRLAVVQISRQRLGTDREVAQIPRFLTMASFPVYSANINRIGLLPFGTLADVVGFYSRALMLAEELSLVGSPQWQSLEGYQKESIRARLEIELDRLVDVCSKAVDSVRKVPRPRP